MENKDHANTIDELFNHYIRYRQSLKLKTKDIILSAFVTKVKTSASGPYLSADIIKEWQCKRQTETNNSYNVRMTHINSFLKFVNGYYGTDYNLAPLVKTEKCKEPIIPTEEQIKLFFRCVDETCGTYTPGRSLQCTTLQKLENIQAPIIFRVLYSTGMRPYEARCLRIEDVDLTQGIIHIKESKGYRHRDIVLHKNMISLLLEYEKNIQTLCPNRKYYFCREKGQRRSKHWPVELFRKYWMRSSGDMNGVVVYCFRHLFVINMINSWSGEDNPDRQFYLLAKAIGHSSPDITIRYYYHLTTFNDINFNDRMRDYFISVVPKIDCGDEK